MSPKSKKRLLIGIRTSSDSPSIIGMGRADLLRFTKDINLTKPQSMIDLLQSTGLTYPQISKKLGVSKFSVGSWAIGRRTPGPDNYQKLLALSKTRSKMVQDPQYKLVKGLVDKIGAVEIKLDDNGDGTYTKPKALDHDTLSYIVEAGEALRNMIVDDFGSDIGYLVHIIIRYSEKPEGYEIWFEGYIYTGRFGSKWERIGSGFKKKDLKEY